MMRQNNRNAIFDIYVLECENNKFYVGRTNNLDHRLQQHFDGLGCEWTYLNKPLDVAKVYYDCSPYDETTITIELMMYYGIDSVRGGAYNMVDLSPQNVKNIIHLVCSAEDRCTRCGFRSHFINNCHSTRWICIPCNKRQPSFKNSYCNQCGLETLPYNSE